MNIEHVPSITNLFMTTNTFCYFRMDISGIVPTGGPKYPCYQINGNPSGYIDTYPFQQPHNRNQPTPYNRWKIVEKPTRKV